MPGRTIQDIIRETAKKHGVPESLALAVAEHESGFNPEAVGPDIPSMPGVRALGTFQLLPETAKQFGVDPADHYGNIEGGVQYLRQLLDASQGDLDLTLKTYGGFKTKDPTPYISDITERMAKFRVGGDMSGAVVPPSPPTAARPVATGRASGAGPAATQPPGMDVSATGTSFLDPVAIGKGLVQPFDPRTPEGRQNLAGLAGEVALSRVPGLRVVAPEIGATLSTATRAANVARRTIVPAAGAGIGAGAEAAIEQATTQRNLSDLITNEPVDSPARVAAEQALYSVGGQVVMWPIRRAGKLVLGSRIGKAAEAGVKAEVAATREAGTRAAAAMRDKVAEGVEAARILERANQDAVKANLHAKLDQAKAAAAAAAGVAEERAGQRVSAARAAAAAKLAQQELDNAELVQIATREYDDLLARPPAVGATIAQTRGVLEGPAKRALEEAGQRVDAAAATGPMISVAPIKTALEGFVKQRRPPSIFEQGGRPRTVGFGPSAAAAAQPVKLPAATMSGGKPLSPQEISNIQAEIAKQLGVPDAHPLPGVIGKILSIPTDQIPFKEAHQIKRLLDEAVNWDRTAKKHLEAITKATRTELRDALGVHEPYNVATAAYHSLVPIYRKGIGKRLSSALMNNPDQAARMLKANDPIQAQTLKDLLVTQAAAGGDARAGQIAWDMARAHFTYDRLIRGGADGLGDRVRALMTEHPEFVKVIADDDAGRAVLQNLATIGDAVKAAKELGAERLATTKAAGKEGVAAARAAGEADVAGTRVRGQEVIADMRKAAADVLRQTRQKGATEIAERQKAGRAEVRSVTERARAATAAAQARQEQLAQSSIMKSSVSGQLADIMRAATLGTGSWFGNLSILRLINGPKGDDLIEWAAYSSQNTQRLTSLLMGQLPDRAASVLLRDIGAALFGGEAPVAQQPAPARAVGAGPVGR